MLCFHIAVAVVQNVTIGYNVYVRKQHWAFCVRRKLPFFVYFPFSLEVKLSSLNNFCASICRPFSPKQLRSLIFYWIIPNSDYSGVEDTNE